VSYGLVSVSLLRTNFTSDLIRSRLGASHRSTTSSPSSVGLVRTIDLFLSESDS
jgi:hypothetical protein